jgi:glycosyltransferase involved in cell wall biosynthesis
VKRACFFAWVRDGDAFAVAEWYATDIRILRDLGYEVVVARAPAKIPPGCELYYSWWWNLSLPALAMARFSGRPHVVAGNVKEVTYAYVGRPWRLREWGERGSTAACLRWSDAVLATSRSEEGVLLERGAARVHLVHHGIDTSWYAPPSRTRDAPTVLTVTHLAYGNLRRKCLSELVAAAALVHVQDPRIRFQVVGGGDRRTLAELMALAAELGVANVIQWVGRVPRDMKRELYQSAAVYLQPTLYEGFGLAIAEAMSCGLPVISSPVGAVPEVTGDAAVLVDGTSPQAIADAVVSLMSDGKTRQHLGNSARGRIEALFTIERRRERVREILEEVTVTRAARS